VNYRHGSPRRPNVQSSTAQTSVMLKRVTDAGAKR
jgi:hypothetical protein